MRTLLELPREIDAVAAVGRAPAAALREPAAVENYVPDTRGAPRSARRIAMQARREQDRRLTGW